MHNIIKHFIYKKKKKNGGSHGSGDGGANMVRTVAEGLADVDEGHL
jgi:hypothetical protein